MKSKQYLIWSEEHGAWWKGTSGYTCSITEAGRFGYARAVTIARKANEFVHPDEGENRGRTFNEIVIPDPMEPWQ